MKTDNEEIHNLMLQKYKDVFLLSELVKICLVMDFAGVCDVSVVEFSRKLTPKRGVYLKCM